MTSPSHLPLRRTFLLAAALVAATVTPAAARGHASSAGRPTPTPPAVAATGCEEHEAWVEGDATAVAARLPRGYTAVAAPSGKPLVFARAEHCKAFTSAGRTAPVTVADWGVVVDSPDGHGCASGVPTVGSVKGDVPPACNWYTLSLVSNDRRVVAWYHQRTPSIPVTYVARLTYHDGPPDALGRTAFHFATAKPTPFTIDDVSSFRPGQISLRGSYWYVVPQGTVHVLVSTDDLTAGHADSTLRTARGSALAQLLGATERASVAPYNDFGVINAAHGVMRKQLLGPPLPGERLTSFAGKCSVSGDVTFTPPATDTQQAAVYSYDATGTCSGTVDGKAVSNAPVRLHQSGHADASCLQAMSFPPGNGVLDFPNRVRLPYTLDFTSKATELDGAAYGTRSGQATGHGTFLTQRSSPTIVTDCATTGARKAPMDMTFSTDSPLVSG